MDSFERFGVTADCNKVLPGMVYVDLQENRCRKDVYNAYHNGASVIFTTQNISDPELPVIKVNNAYETMLLLLNKHFQNPQDKVKLIAISGSNDKDIVLDLLYRILDSKAGRLNNDEVKGFEKYISSLNSMTIEDMYEYLNNIVSGKELFTPIVVDYKLKYFRFINSFKFDCALITGVDSSDFGDQNYVLGGIRSFISRIPDRKPIIVNNDDDTVLKALEASRNTIVISYGLNKKAAVTATSIDFNQQTSFNYCLQRSFTTNSGALLEPFEIPISINMIGSRSIYCALAAITCALYYDIDIEQIKKVLKDYTLPSRRLEISTVKGVTILDNYCCSPQELDKMLEIIQMLNYNRLKLLISLSKNDNWKDGSDAVKIINLWSDMLGIDESVLCGCLDIDDKITPLSIYDVIRLKKSAGSSLFLKYFDKLQEAIKYIADNIKEGDMVILAGGEEMNNAKKLFENYLLSSNAIKALH